MNILSLFDGISCGRIALERANIPVEKYFASEIEKSSIEISKYNYPDIIQLGDIKNISYKDGMLISGDEKYEIKIDLLIGGSPCTNFSFMGKQKGMSTIDNEKIISLDHYLELKNNNFEFEGQSYLFWEYVRLYKEINPTYFLLENVRMAPQWSKIISEVFRFEPRVIDSNLFSAQNRHRIYWTNIDYPQIPVYQSRLKFKDIKDHDGPHRYLSEAILNKMANREYVYRTSYMIQDDNKKVRCLTTVNAASDKIKCCGDDNKIRFISILECERIQTVPDHYTKAPNVSEAKRGAALGNGWTVNVIAHIFKGLTKPPRKIHTLF